MTANGSSNASGSIARKLVVYRDFWKVFVNVVQIYGRIHFEGISYLLFYSVMITILIFNVSFIISH